MSAESPVTTTLGNAINQEVAAAKEAAANAVEHARLAGELLAQAKAQCPHGTWGKWLRENVDLSERTARAYMQLARRWQALPEEERQRVADLPLRQVLAEGARTGLGEGMTPENSDRKVRALEAKTRGLQLWLDDAESSGDTEGLVQIRKELLDLLHAISNHKLRVERELGRLLTEVRAKAKDAPKYRKASYPEYPESVGFKIVASGRTAEEIGDHSVAATADALLRGKIPTTFPTREMWITHGDGCPITAPRTGDGAICSCKSVEVTFPSEEMVHAAESVLGGQA